MNSELTTLVDARWCPTTPLTRSNEQPPAALPATGRGCSPSSPDRWFLAILGKPSTAEFLNHTSGRAASPTLTAKGLPCRLFKGWPASVPPHPREMVKYTRALNRWWSAPGTCLTHPLSRFWGLISSTSRLHKHRDSGEEARALHCQAAYNLPQPLSALIASSPRRLMGALAFRPELRLYDGILSSCALHMLLRQTSAT
jgi:hypothetical protein